MKELKGFPDHNFCDCYKSSANLLHAKNKCFVLTFWFIFPISWVENLSLFILKEMYYLLHTTYSMTPAILELLRILILATSIMYHNW